MARLLGKILALIGVVLMLANAGCFARCLVEACDAPPPCHSHKQGHDHCPDQHSLKAFAADLATSDGLAVIPMDRSIELAGTLAQAFGFEESGPVTSATGSAILPLRI